MKALRACLLCATPVPVAAQLYCVYSCPILDLARMSCAGVALEVPEDLPRAPQLLQRWLGQPLKALLLPTSCFTTNKRGYPVLGKAHQDLVGSALRHGVQVGGGRGCWV